MGAQNKTGRLSPPRFAYLTSYLLVLRYGLLSYSLFLCVFGDFLRRLLGDDEIFDAVIGLGG